MTRVPAADSLARRGERLWLLGLLTVTACSWGRWLATGSPKVDENYPRESTGMLLLLVLAGGWAALVVGWSQLLARPPRRPRWLAYGGLLAASLMLPMLSNDFFSLLTYGSLAAAGRDVYTTANGLPQSVWYGWIGQHWNDTVCVYGPTTLAATLPAALAHDNPWVALAVFRLFWLPPLVLVMEATFRSLRDRPSFHAMVWLNPLWLLEGPGQLHSDLLGVTALVAGITCGLQRKTVRSWVFYALAALGKFTFGFAGPWFWLAHAPGGRRRLAARIPAMALVVLAVAVAAYAPFWRGPATLTAPVAALGQANPGGSITEVVADVVDILRGGGAPRADAPVQLEAQADRKRKGPTWLWVTWLLRVLFVAVAARLFAVLLRKPGDEKTALATGALMVAAVTLASHRFQSWYLLGALPFFGLCCPPVWRRWWVAVVAIAVTPQFVYLLPRTALVLPVWSAVATAATVLLFLASFRARYWDPDLGDAERSKPAPSPASLTPPGPASDPSRGDA